MCAMSPQCFKSECAKSRDKPPRPPQEVPGAQEIDSTERCVAPMRSAFAERRIRERDRMVNRCAHKQCSDDAKEGLAGHFVLPSAR